MLRAGAEIWVSDGWAAVSMRAVCARAGLTDRYFYEEFDNVDDLLGTLWDEVRDEVVAVLLADIAARADESPLDRLHSGISVFVTYLATHVDRAAILYGDGAGCAVLVLRQRELRTTGTAVIADLARPLLRSEAELADFLILGRMAIGGFLELIAAWQAGAVAGTVVEIVAHATKFGDLLAAGVAPARTLDWGDA